MSTFSDKTDKLDKKIVYEEFLKIYNTKSYNFAYDKLKMINFYNSWKKNNIKFSKYSIFLEHNIINKNKENLNIFMYILINIKNLLYVNMLFG